MQRKTNIAEKFDMLISSIRGIPHVEKTRQRVEILVTNSNAGKRLVNSDPDDSEDLDYSPAVPSKGLLSVIATLQRVVDSGRATPDQFESLRTIQQILES